MDQLFSNTAPTWRHLHEGLLGPHLVYVNEIVAQRLEQGYAHSTLIVQLQLLVRLGAWLKTRDLELEQLTSHIVVEFLRDCRVTVKSRGLAGLANDVIARLVDRQIICRGPVAAKTPDPIESVTAAFGHFLLRERGLTEATRRHYIPFIERLLQERFESQSVHLDELTAKDASDFVRRHARDHSHGHTRVMVTALRVFFKYLLLEGLIHVDLSGAVPPVADWRLQSLPKALPADDVEKLLSHCNLRNPAGHRDYAILLLLARLGLRAGDVVHLKLCDLDWEAGEIVLSGKSRRLHRLPLPQEVGEAVASYLQHARPKLAMSRRVFVRARPPYYGFRSSVAICSVMRRALRRAGLAPARQGAHLLRHGLATRMLKGGASLAEIGQVLRHQHQDTTSIYAKVDLDSLRSVAPSWPGGAS